MLVVVVGCKVVMVCFHETRIQIMRMKQGKDMKQQRINKRCCLGVKVRAMFKESQAVQP